MPFVSITRLRLRSFWHLPRFFYHAARSTSQAKRSPGHIQMDALNDAKLAFWTKTLWKDEASMRAFLLSGAHRKAMPVLQELVDEAATAHWVQASETLPTWPEAYVRLLGQAHFTRIKHPSADHSAGKIAPPRA